MIRAVAAVLALVLSACFTVLRLAPAWFLSAPPRGLFFCAQPGMNPTHPSAMHLEPGLVEHVNWLDFPVRADPPPNRWGLCVDGRGISFEPAYVDGKLARFNIQTRLVNLLWLTKRLDEYAKPGPWVLTYATCARGQDGTLDCV